MAARSKASKKVAPVPVPAPPSRWRLDLSAAILFIAGLLAAVCVFSHDPADPPAANVYPANPRPANLLGEPGAGLSHGLLSALGYASPVLLAAWFVLVLMLFLRRNVLRWSIRLTGWILLVPLTAILADRWAF
jgi:hypothetical protein